MENIAFAEIEPDLQKPWLNPPKLSLSQWAEMYAYLSPESAAEPGKWHSFPYQIGIMDAVTDPEIETVVLMKSARVGYTKILNHCTAYHIEHDPCNQLLVQPTIEDAEGHSKDEIAPMLRDTKCLKGIVSEVGGRMSENTTLKKAYPGGRLYLVGSNSPRGFRRISARIIMFDEVDGYPPTAGKEGDQIKLGIMRSAFFWNRKIIIGSTPTIKGFSRIESEFKSSDQRYYLTPCPFCKYKQRLVFGNKESSCGFKWPKDEPKKTRYMCENCGELIPHSKKRWMVENGEWQATKESNGKAGFHIWAAYSFAPNATWGQIATEFLESKNNIEKLQVWVNTIKGETFEQAGDQPPWEELKARCQPYKFMEPPNEAGLLTAGIDTQDDRLEVVIRAWGANENSWLVYWGTLYGDPAEDEVWQQLDNLLNRTYEQPNGGKLQIISMGIDSGGHRTQPVYNYCRFRSPRVIATKGSHLRNKPVLSMTPTDQDVTYAGEKIKGSVKLWILGTDTAKSIIYARLGIIEGIGAYHWPIGLPDEYFKQLTSERLITEINKKTGRKERNWVKLRENHALDCEVIAYAAAIRAGLVYYDLKKIPIKKKKNNREEIYNPDIRMNKEVKFKRPDMSKIRERLNR